MAREIALFTGQWGGKEYGLEKLAKKASQWGFNALELSCWGGYFDVEKALSSDTYCQEVVDILKKHGMTVNAVSNHLAGQAVCDRIDLRHKSILPPHIWARFIGGQEGVRERAAEEMKNTAIAARKLANVVGHDIVVCGFTGSSIWHLLYSFPPVSPKMIEDGYKDFAKRWNPILDVFDKENVKFGLEVHPTEIAFDIVTAERAIDALGGRKAFGFNYDPSHLGYQGVDYVEFIRRFGDRIYHVHMKDVGWSSVPKPSGVFGGHLNFGDVNRYWDFRSLGRGNIDFEGIIRMLNRIGYPGELSIEWEDSGMDQEQGAEESCEFVKAVDILPSATAFDAAFEKK